MPNPQEQINLNDLGIKPESEAQESVDLNEADLEMINVLKNSRAEKNKEFFTHAVGAMHLVIDNHPEVFNEDFKARFNNFKLDKTSRAFNASEPTAEDFEEADRLIDEFLTAISK